MRETRDFTEDFLGLGVICPLKHKCSDTARAKLSSAAVERVDGFLRANIADKGERGDRTFIVCLPRVSENFADLCVSANEARAEGAPLLKLELATRAFIMRGLARLGLDAEPLKAIGRPASQFGWTPDAD
jgi:hypothetical protein